MSVEELTQNYWNLVGPWRLRKLPAAKQGLERLLGYHNLTDKLRVRIEKALAA